MQNGDSRNLSGINTPITYLSRIKAVITVLGHWYLVQYSIVTSVRIILTSSPPPPIAGKTLL